MGNAAPPPGDVDWALSDACNAPSWKTAAARAEDIARLFAFPRQRQGAQDHRIAVYRGWGPVGGLSARTPASSCKGVFRRATRQPSATVRTAVRLAETRCSSKVVPVQRSSRRMPAREVPGRHRA